MFKQRNPFSLLLIILVTISSIFFTVILIEYIVDFSSLTQIEEIYLKNSTVLIVSGILLTHYIAGYVFVTKSLAELKIKSTYWVLLHSVFYSMCFIWLGNTNFMISVLAIDLIVTLLVRYLMIRFYKDRVENYQTFWIIVSLGEFLSINGLLISYYYFVYV